jgi:hypothetical protein
MSYRTQTRKNEIFFMILNKNLDPLSQVKDDLPFLIDRDRLNKALEEVNKTEEKVHQILSALEEFVQKLFSDPRLE